MGKPRPQPPRTRSQLTRSLTVGPRCMGKLHSPSSPHARPLSLRSARMGNCLPRSPCQTTLAKSNDFLLLPTAKTKPSQLLSPSTLPCRLHPCSPGQIPVFQNTQVHRPSRRKPQLLSLSPQRLDPFATLSSLPPHLESLLLQIPPPGPLPGLRRRRYRPGKRWVWRLERACMFVWLYAGS